MNKTLNLQLHARAQSWNWEVNIGTPINVQKIGEFSKGGEEGSIEVVDGSRRYKIGDQIFGTDEIEISVLVKNANERAEYDALMSYAESSKPRDVYVTGRDGEGVAQMSFIFTNCRLRRGKLNAFDRKSKAEQTHTFFLLPENIEAV
jgi:hypothetical protein